MTSARAHPNIALVKYWGKSDESANIPATPSVSITLSDLVTETTVETAERDSLVMNGEETADTKIQSFLDLMRTQFDVPPLTIVTDNNFPTGAGLASSASGFAALITALNVHCDLSLDRNQTSIWARRGSASAARSIYGGYVSLSGPEWYARQILTAEHWPLTVVIAIVSEGKKAVSSTRGMRISRETSSFYNAWVASSVDDYRNALEAIDARDFDALARIAESSCLKMHGVMLTSYPTLQYWLEPTLACMNAVRNLREEDIDVFFTIDAGPQVKAVCRSEHTRAVVRALESVPGVVRTLTTGLGQGAE